MQHGFASSGRNKKRRLQHNHNNWFRLTISYNFWKKRGANGKRKKFLLKFQPKEKKVHQKRGLLLSGTKDLNQTTEDEEEDIWDSLQWRVFSKEVDDVMPKLMWKLTLLGISFSWIDVPSFGIVGSWTKMTVLSETLNLLLETSDENRQTLLPYENWCNLSK